MSAPLNLLAIVALLPAAANPALLARGEALALSLCGGGSLTIPANTPLPNADGAACCNKGCHSNDKRKRGKRVQGA
jgi:hypothetical protein